MIEVVQNIPLEKFYVFHDILKATKGRYLSNPVHDEVNKTVRVHFTSYDYPAHEAAWSRVITPIVETYRKPSLLTKIKRFFKL